MRVNRIKTRELTCEEEEEIRDRLRVLAQEGKQVVGTSMKNDTDVRPVYYDEARFDQAQKTVNKYHASLFAAASMGLMLLLQLEEILIPLLKTGKSRTVVDLYDRYTATAKYIKRCYETNFFDKTSEGWKYLSMVRSMHQRVCKMMNSPECNSLAKPDSEIDNYVWVNQYDMALTQFAFIGLLILRPDKCGAYHVNEKEMNNIIYYWQLLSYQLGIEDKFNLFVHSHDLAKQVRLIELVFSEYERKLAKPRNQTGLGMARGFLLAFEDLASEATFNIIEHHWKEVVSLSGNEKLEPYEGLGERWKLLRFRLIFKFLLKSELMMHYINLIYKRKLEKFCKDGAKIKKKLAKRYPNHIYELNNEVGMTQ